VKQYPYRGLAVALLLGVGFWGWRTLPPAPPADRASAGAAGPDAGAAAVRAPAPRRTGRPLPPRTAPGAAPAAAGAQRASAPPPAPPSLRSARPGGLADPAYRRRQASIRRRRRQAATAAARERAREGAWALSANGPDPAARELMAVRGGQVLVYQTENANAAVTTAADLVRDLPAFDVQGSNVTVGVWDAGLVRASHQEYAGRVTSMDPGAAMHYHATHVFGTIAAAGVSPQAKGMAPAARGASYDWNADAAEMTERALAAPGETNGIPISNHSYGHIAGWTSNPWQWYGTWTPGVRESDLFGLYSLEAAEWDAICYEAPYYVPVKSAGNDRADGPPAGGTSFSYFNGVNWVQKTYDPDADPLGDGQKGGYDTLPDIANAKNVLVIGAVGDALIGNQRALSQATIQSYSGWGPTDDGRIKPDLVANGSALYSADSGYDADYTSLSGTSMAAANASGSLALLAAYHRRLFDRPARGATLRGLAAHTADDLGPAGPDYRSGWGLMNTAAAAELLRRHARFPAAGLLREASLGGTNAVDRFTVHAHGTNALRVTLCWTDPPGLAQTGLNSRAAVLVNDLDLRVTGPAAMHAPFVLAPTNPAAAAVTGDNVLDNIEQVLIPAPAATTYTVRVSHKGTLTNGVQHYTLLLSGVTGPPSIEHVPLPNTAVVDAPYTVDAVIDAVSPLDTNRLTVFWTTNAPAGPFAAAPLAHVSDRTYRAAIPPQPVGAVVAYYLSAETELGLRSADPPSAPAAWHSFAVTPEIPFTVLGSPTTLGTVAPAYGTHIMASGIVVEAVAEPFTPVVNGHRNACIGWTGTESVPASGELPTVSFLLTRASHLLWRWQSQWRLRQTSSEAGLLATNTWWPDGAAGTTVTAPETFPAGDLTYRFVEWQVDGARRPDPDAVAANPAAPLAMTAARDAVAVVLPEDTDSDQDALPDWWERRYFGSLAPGPGGDEDGDGYLDLEEAQDRTNPRDPGSVPEGPVIAHTPLPATIGRPAPWRLEAAITDNDEVAAAVLRWRRNGLAWRQVALTATGAVHRFTAELPAPGLLGDTIEYVIQAADRAGYVAESGPHTCFVAYPVQELDTPVVTALLLPGAATNRTVAFRNTGNTNLHWTARLLATGAFDDMESGTNTWTHGGLNDQWHLTARRAWSGSNAWYCGSDAAQEYTDSMDASLVLPRVHLAENAHLTFRHWCNTELDSGDYAWDGAVVEISTDRGATFSMLTPDGGYPYRIVENPASPFEPDTPCFAGTGGWERVTVDLSAHAGAEADIRFRFGSDAYVVDEGWYIDDVRIEPRSATTEWLALAGANGVTPAGAAAGIDLALSTQGLDSGDDDVWFLELAGNDPLDPVDRARIQVRVRSYPEFTLTGAAQTSRAGEGIVTVTGLVYDVDHRPAAAELLYSTDGGAQWRPAAIAAADAAFGPPPAATGNMPQVTGIATDEGGTPATNAVAFRWSTTNGPASILLATNTRIRVRLWDGDFWSEPAVSPPFLVDNEPPAAPAPFAVLTHETNVWSTSPTFLLYWENRYDGDGIGLRGTLYSVTAEPAFDPAAAELATGRFAIRGGVPDGTNLWARLAAVDRYGNVGAPVEAGPFRVDTLPPSAAGAVVTAELSPFGPYVVGTAVPCRWSGFTDAGAGIEGYYVSIDAGAGGGTESWTTNLSRTLAAAVADGHNTVRVRARDRLGWVGAHALGEVLVLSDAADHDGDALSNAAEELAGTDAADAASAFKSAGAVTNGQVVLTWQGVSGRLYGILQTDDVTAGPWRPVPGYTNIPGIDGTMSYTGTVDITGRRFYRVGVGMP